MSDIDEIKSRLDIVDVVSQYVPTLKRAGQSYKGNCPFHKEKTPSFIVTPSMQIYKCFGCGEGGDAIKFIEKMERVEFGEALQIAAERVGYKLSQRQSAKDSVYKQEADLVFKLNELAGKYWNYLLSEHKAGQAGRNYLQKRQIRMEEVKTFQMGYAPAGDNLIKFLTGKGYTPDQAVKAGLGVERQGKIMDKFRDRLMLPIMNMKGQIVGFSGRQITPSEYSPKYLNSPETAVYKKGEILMGLFQAKEAARADNFLVLEEGNIDLLSSHKVGVKNIAATGGTALTLMQCKLIKRHVDTVYFCFDTDQAGLKALIKGVELSEQIGLKHKALNIGDYQDPDQLISTEPARWKEVIANPINTITHLITVFQKDLDLGSADGKSEFFYRMVPILRTLKDPVQQEHYSGEVAVISGISKDRVMEEINSSNPTPAQYQPKPEQKQQPQPQELQAKMKQFENQILSTREIYILGLLLQMESPRELEISGEIFQDVDCREVFAQIQKLDNLTTDFTKLADVLSEGGREALQQALAVDISEIEHPQEELLRIYKVLYKNHLRREVLNLRTSLQTLPDDEQSLQKLTYLIKELKQFA